MAEAFTGVEKKKPVKEVFDKLYYGPAPESADSFDDWLKQQDKKLGFFINNEWRKPADRKTEAVISPATEEELCRVIQGNQQDVDEAVEAAGRGFSSWSALSGAERAKFIYSLARHVQKHARILAVCESLDNGKSFRETKNADVKLLVRHLYHHAGWAALMDDEMADFKPLGVVACVVPWNFPLMLLAWKICPAIAMGNTVVVKPAPNTMLSALLFAQICAEAGLPPGVLNVVTCDNPTASYLVDHPAVAKIAFTGSTAVGQLIRRRIAGTGKVVTMELGGKSPFIVFDDADLDSAVEGVVDSIFFNQGQVCCAGSRLLIQEGIYEQFLAKVKRRLSVWRLGHSLEKNIDMGPLISKEHQQKVAGYVSRARSEGCEVWQAPVPIPSKGFFFPPTLIIGCTTTNECVAEEIFGPVLTVLTFRGPAEAIKLANNTKYGLAASIWSNDVNLALELAVAVKAGVIWVNTTNQFDAASGFGGYKQSGFGRDGGKEGLYDFVRPKWSTRPVTKIKAPVQSVKWSSQTPTLPASLEESKKAQLQSVLGGTTIDRTPKMYIGGKQARPDGEYSRPIYAHRANARLAAVLGQLNAEQRATEARELLSQVAEGNRKDIRNAVEAAQKAAPGWGKRAAHNRAQICYYIAENLEIRAMEFATRIQAQTGRDIEDCKAEVQESIQRLFYYAAYADKFGGTVQETQLYGVTIAIHEPIGVIAIACPDEYPLLGFISLICPAITRGNAVVVIPSPGSPLCATDLYQVLDTSDLPGGVINIVTGDRDTLAKTLAEHQDVEAMWYFGSEEGCRNVEFASADNMKRSWVSYGQTRNWMSREQGQGTEFLRHSVQVKNIWVPFGVVPP